LQGELFAEDFLASVFGGLELAANGLEELNCGQDFFDVGQDANVTDVYLLVPNRLEFISDEQDQLRIRLISQRAEHTRQNRAAVL